MSDPISVIALHGNGGGGFRFARAQPHFPADMAFVTPTLPGFAGEPRDPALQSVGDYAAVLYETVAQQPRPRVVLGTGIGGSIVLQMAQEHAGGIDGLILHAPVGTRLDTRLFPRLMRLPGMKTAGKLTFASPITRPLFRRLLFQAPVPDDYTNRFFAEYRRCTVFGQMFDIITPEWFASLQPISVPTVLLWGEKERILQVDQLEDYKALLPNHRVHVEPGWDHFPMVDMPDAFASVVSALARDLVQRAS